MRQFWCLFSILVVTFAACVAMADDKDWVKEQLLLQPPMKLIQEVQRQSQVGLSPNPIDVDYFRVDLDGSGQYRFVVAAFHMGDSPAYCCVYLRIFEQQNGKLTLVGEQEDQQLHGGYGLQMKFVDIDGDGIPEIELEGTEGAGQYTTDEYFGWTGASLHRLTTALAVRNAGLEDIDGDGISELIVPSGDNSWDTYKFDGKGFAFWQNFNYDPQGLVGADGSFHLVRAFLADFRPSTFALASINSSSPKERGKVKLVLGDLRDTKGNTVGVDQVDTSTIVLGTNVRPTGVSIRGATQQDIDADRAPKNSGSFSEILEVEFSRADILKWLPKLKLTAPLASGDNLELKVRGKLKDGTRVSVVSTVTIQESPQ